MKNEYYAFSMTSSSPTSDFIAHYGVMGMKWGVRKAIVKGNQRALDRHFRKAAKKLAKLQDIGLNSGKYAAKSAAYGAAAVGTGTMAIGGTGVLSGIMRKKAAGLMAKARYAEASQHIGSTLSSNSPFTNAKAKEFANESAKAAAKADSIDKWGKSGLKQYNQMTEIKNPKTGEITYKVQKVNGTIDNNARVRIGAGIATIGLGTMAGINAYRAANPQKYRQKAIEFKNEMDNSFAGTKYAGQYVAQPRVRKRKRR